MTRLSAIACVLILLMWMGGCVLAPPELKSEQAQLAVAANPYTRPVNRRDLPYVPFQPTWQQVLRRAFLANGDLEIAYDRWAQALARVRDLGAYPNTSLAIGFDELFSAGHMTTWDRTTLSAGPDPQTDLMFPTKVAQAGKAALAQAIAARHRFEQAKFELQRKCLVAYWDLIEMDQDVRIQQKNVELLTLLSQTAADRVRAGGPQQDLLKAQIAQHLAENELATLDNQHGVMITTLNTIMGRDPEAPILGPETLPTSRPLPADDGTLITLSVDKNPELAALQSDVDSSAGNVELARMAIIPDINPMGAVTGSLSQSLGAVVILPFTTPRWQAQIDEAKAMLDESHASLRQTRLDRSGTFIATLLSLRDDERAADLLEKTILPKAEEDLRLSRDAYIAGGQSFADLIDTQRTLLQVQMMAVNAHMDREKRLTELEALAGRDLTNVGSLPFYLLKARALRLHDAGPKKPGAPTTDISPAGTFIQ